MTDTPISPREWRLQFVALHGHEPSFEEYQAAVESGTIIQPSTQNPSSEVPVTQMEPSFDAIHESLVKTRDTIENTLNTTLSDAKSYSSLSTDKRTDLIIFGNVVLAVLALLTFFLPYEYKGRNWFNMIVSLPDGGMYPPLFRFSYSFSDISIKYLFPLVLILVIIVSAAVRFAGKASYRKVALLSALLPGAVLVIEYIVTGILNSFWGESLSNVGTWLGALILPIINLQYLFIRYGYGLAFILSIIMLVLSLRAYDSYSHKDARISVSHQNHVEDEATHASTVSVSPSVPTVEEWVRSFTESNGRVPSESEFRTAFNRGDFRVK